MVWLFRLLPILVIGELCAAAQTPLRAPETVAVYSRWEARLPELDVPAGTAAFDPGSFRLDATITLPTLETVVLPGFLFRDYTRDRRGEAEVLTPAGAPEWRLRYTPIHHGRHLVRVTLRRDGGPPVTVAETSFVAGEPAPGARGFLRLNPDLPARFVFDNGEGYFALGHNLCWVEEHRGTYGFDGYFEKMAAAGENYARIWTCSWSLSLQTKTPYEIDLEDAWRLDRVLTAAGERDIYVLLCLDNFYDFVHHWDRSPFNPVNGGPCTRKEYWFTGDSAKRQYRARLRYLVGRYGAHASLLGWELWNEMNYTLGGTASLEDDRIRGNILIPWTRETAAHLRALDPHRHMIGTSLGMHTSWPALWEDPHIGFVQYHSYINRPVLMSSDLERDAAAFALYGYRLVSGYGKPAFLGEYGYVGEGQTSPLNPDDPRGIALHNALWAGAMSGAAGTPMFWWWDNYIGKNDLYDHYRGLSTFLEGVDWTKRFVPMRVESKTVRVLALRAEDEILLWVQNLSNRWYDRIRLRRPVQPFSGLKLQFADFPSGEYAIEWFDPYAAEVMARELLPAPRGRMVLKVPRVERDLAARLRSTRKEQK